MQFRESFQQADGLAGQALDFMRAYKVPPIPSNYTVWYAYASHQMPELTSAINAHIAKNEPFTSDINTRLYEQYFSNSDMDALLMETGAKIGKEVSGVMDILGTASDQFSGFQNNIKTNLQQFDAGDPAVDFETFIQSVVKETWKMHDSNAQLQAQLQSSASEIDTLRETIEVVQRESMTDGLTGIANRKMFDGALRDAIAKAEEKGEPLCLALTDIDFFKKFNDTYGHQIGDQVLKLVANALDNNVKGRDLAARYGGEEFALILPSTRLDDAVNLCDQIRRAIASKKIRKKNSADDFGNVTMSFGIAEVRAREGSDSLIARADAALYRAKDAGRNQCAAAN